MSLEIQSRFATALEDGSQDVPQGLAAWNGPRPGRRFGVYRNNVFAGLIDALASRFPATEKIAGEAFFAGMAHAFIRLHPPTSPLLLYYGDNLADFAERFEPARQLDYLADVIRLEAARGRAYHAADAPPLEGAMLAALAPQTLPDLTLMPHPAMAVIRSSHPVVSIWGMNAGELPFGPIDWQGEDALVTRPHMIVEVHRLPAGGAAFLTVLADGRTLGQAAEAAIADAPDFDLAANLAGLLLSGAFTAIRQDDQEFRR